MRSSAHPPIRSFARLHTLLTSSPFSSHPSRPWQSTKPKLRQLYLAGNPFALRKDFRACVLATLPQLVILDEALVGPEEVAQVCHFL